MRRSSSMRYSGDSHIFFHWKPVLICEQWPAWCLCPCPLTLTWLSSRSGRKGRGKNSARRLNRLHQGITICKRNNITWWRHQMETFSALLALCVGNSPVTGEFPSQRPVMWSFDVFFDLRQNKPFGKQSRGWWFETPSCSLWRHCNESINKSISLCKTDIIPGSVSIKLDMSQHCLSLGAKW